MKATKEQLLEFIEKRVLQPAEDSTSTIKRKVNYTRMALNRIETAEKVEQYFWSAMSTDNGIDSYTKFKEQSLNTFEDVRAEFKTLCGRK